MAVNQLPLEFLATLRQIYIRSLKNINIIYKNDDVQTYCSVDQFRLKELNQTNIHGGGVVYPRRKTFAWAAKKKLLESSSQYHCQDYC